MKDVKITVKKIVTHTDLIELYENPLRSTCSMKVGMTFVSKEAQIPEGFCQSAWSDLYPYVFALANGACDIFDGWMKDPYSAMISCNDGFRPVSFYLETKKDS